MEPYKPFIEEMLVADTTAPRKQRHTARRIHARLEFDANPNINPATIHQLASGDWGC